VQPKSLSLLRDRSFKVMVFVGARQKVDVDLANAMQTLGCDGSYVPICGIGRNALDFHIAFTLGELSASSPGSRFFVISKDAGFDLLLSYVRKRGTTAIRLNGIDDLAGAVERQEKLAVVVRNLTSRGCSRPRGVKALVNTIKTLFPPGMLDAEIESLIAALARDGYLSIENGAVSYG
jgi:hypothetical protein